MSIRDDSTNDAARVRAALALEELHNPKQAAGVNVNVGIQNSLNQQTILPGYVLDLSALNPAPTIEGNAD
jgi:hypothetical protein